MIGPNLSEWSLKRPSFIVFLMLLVVAAGVIAFKDLGRDEDPPFTVRTMIVAAMHLMVLPDAVGPEQRQLPAR